MKKRYNHKKLEPKIYQKWENSGYFNPDNLPDVTEDSYSIVLPPPNITGSLHMGHALNATIQDILIRKKRMAGYEAEWLPGIDHAGIATQNKVEEKLKKEGKTRFDLGREKFLEEVWKWKEDTAEKIFNQFRKMGVSCDWSRQRFTMDEGYEKSVEEAFKQYQEKGWLYQKKRVVNWCPRCGTTLSDLELEFEEKESHLWYIKYPLAENKDKYITVATTRPETLLGDTAIAISPGDKKYSDFVNKKVILPLTEEEIPVVEHHLVESDFGTGAVKVTPAHDYNDYIIGLEKDLDLKQVINEDGKMTGDIPERYQGLEVLEARKKIVDELKKKGFLVKTEDYTHQVPHCYRCDSRIEPIPLLQWFVDMDKLAAKARQAVEEGKIEFHPPRWKKVYFERLDNMRDWCISRQLWWGHKIPIEGDNDVLDTWFSSALWPFAGFGWPEKTADLKKFYPTNVVSTAPDILHLWVTRMIFSGLEFMDEIPFNEVLFHPTIFTRNGRRMSKSLGTGIDPLELIDQYGADATRFGLMWQTTYGRQDIRFTEEDIMMGEKFGTKIWNVARFILMQADKVKLEKLDLSNINNDDFVEKLNETAKNFDQHIENYEFSKATHLIYDFFWDNFASGYLEKQKDIVYGDKASEKEKQKTVNTLAYVLVTSLKLLHPVMPYLTEEIYSKLPLKKKKEFLMIEDWPVK